MGSGTSKSTLGKDKQFSASSDNVSSIVTPRNDQRGESGAGMTKEQLVKALKEEKIKHELCSLQLVTAKKKTEEAEAELTQTKTKVSELETSQKQLKSLLLTAGKKSDDSEDRSALLDRPKFFSILDEWRLVIFKGNSVREIFDKICSGGDASGFDAQKLKAHLSAREESALTDEENKAFFGLLDVDNDGAVSALDFEVAVARPMFCQGVSNYLGTLKLEDKLAHRLAPKNPCVDGKLIDILKWFAELQPADIHEKMQGLQEEIQTELEKQNKEKQAQLQELSIRTQAEASDKFSLIKANFGNLKDFKEGMEAYLGLPDKEIFKAMQFEHREEKEFKTANYGLSTSLQREFDFVFKPDPSIQYPGEGGTGRRRLDLNELLEHPDAKKAGLTFEEVGALALYTGPCYMYYNDVMRRRPKKNPFRNTLLMLISGTMKLTETTSLWKQRMVYRGLRDMELPKAFYNKDEYGCRGGLEWGMMSTSLDKDQASRYAAGSNGVLFEIDMGQVDRGANLSWISQYPQEQEILFPPGSYVEVMSGPRVEIIEGQALLIWGLRLSVNMKHLTREELENKRKTLFLASLRNIVDEVGREAEQVAMQEECINSALLAGQLDDAKRSIVIECNDKMKMFSKKASAWYNNDLSYQSAVMEAAKLKRLAIGKFRTIMMNSALGFRTWQRTTMDDSNRKDVLTLARSYFAACDATNPDEYWHKFATLGVDGKKPTLDEDGRVVVPPEVRRLAIILSHREGFLSSTDPSTVDLPIDSEGATALMMAVEEGHPGRAKQLIDAGCSLTVRNNEGRTALMQSAVHGSCNCVEKLVLAGSEVEEVDADGRSATMLAAEAGHLLCLRKILPSKPNLDLRSTDEMNMTAILLAAREGHAEVFKDLREAGADVQAKAVAGATAILIAAEQGHTEIVKFCCETGLDPEKHDEFKRTPLIHTCHHNNIECFKFLLEKDCNVNHQDKFGESPVMFAAAAGNMEILEILLSKGADPRAKDNTGQDAMAYAVKQNQQKAQEVLQKWLAENPAD